MIFDYFLAFAVLLIGCLFAFIAVMSFERGRFVARSVFPTTLILSAVLFGISIGLFITAGAA